MGFPENKEAVASIHATILEQITFASQQNDVAPISDLVVINNSDDTLEDLTLTLHASPEIVQQRSWPIDRLNPHVELRLQNRSVLMSADMLQKLTERMHATVTLQLHKGEELLAEFAHNLTALARNEWGGAAYMPELLAAFVTPNDPAVDTVLKDASEVLRRAGERHAIEGYQSKSRKRVYTLASAVWSAVAAKRLTYAEPPASFEQFGQKLRSPGQIWERGLATCLDTTVLFAAALEQAGLYPVIAFTKGHAFCGVWLQPQNLPSLTTDDCVEVRKYIAAKELVLFETTLVTGEPPATFRQAVSRGEDKLAEALEDEFVYALDVKQARHRGISPLPSVDTIASASSGNAQTAPAAFGLDAAPELPAFDFGIEIEGNRAETPETRLDMWRRKLLDLTKRNRLLNLKPTKTAIRLICPNPAELEDRLAAGEKIGVIPLEKISGEYGERDPELFRQRTGADFEMEFAARAMERGQVVADLEAGELEKGLIELYRKSRADIREGGANTLFLAIGVLRWKQAEEEQRSYRAPLLLVPVTLERKSARSPVRIVLHDDEPTFNMTLLEMLRQDFEVSIPMLAGELPKDDSGVDVPLVWEVVRRAVKEIPGFEVREEVVLSTFSFAKYLMWKDLADRTDALKKSALVRHLIDNPRDPYERQTDFVNPREIDKKISPSELYMPLPADSSQIVAVHASGQQSDFVLEGPPGTGKSQTIANIIAQNLALGRKVLFVSEKMAALEVVYNRLKRHGLGDFCLELHSNKANKKAVIDHFGQAWKSRQMLTSGDWARETDRLANLRDQLNALVGEIHRPAASGVSPYRAIGRAVRYKDLHRVELDWGKRLADDPVCSPERYAELQDVVKQLALAYSEIESLDAGMLGTIQHQDWSYAWQGQVVAAAKKLGDDTKALIGRVTNFQRALGLPDGPVSAQHLTGLDALGACIPDAAKYDLSLAFDVGAGESLTAAEKAGQALQEYRRHTETLSDAVASDVIESIPVTELQQRWDNSAKALIGIKQWQRMSIRSVLRKSAGKAKLHPEHDLPILKSLQACRRDMVDLEGQISPTLGWQGLATKSEQMAARIAAVRKLKAVIALNAHDLESLVALKSALRKALVDGRELLQAGMPIRAAADSFTAALGTYRVSCGEFSTLAGTDVLSLAPGDVISVSEAIERLQPHLNAWCRWRKACAIARADQLDAMIAGLELKLVDASDAVGAFKTAYARWLAPKLIDEREALRTFSALTHENLINAFRDLDQKVADLSVDFIRTRLSGNIHAETDPSRPPGYKVLAHEMNKQRAHKPVRQLFAEMGNVVTSLTPCMLMSPLSIAQFLPPDADLFDLVVFDEASQITVWDAIGAIARGKNVIVVGDPKQMPPTNFFNKSADDEGDDDGDNVQDLESILDEALASSVPVHRLTGHYRSKHESLIAFSNHAYYKGDLITYPASDTRESAVTFVQVDGLYQRGKRINEKEAKAIVAEVVRRLTDRKLSSQSIGIVTMNTEQQRLIDDLLDRERVKNPALEPFFDEENPRHVFVRNLETVQGDERDVILISIGFGPTVPGAKTMSMNFGALNRKGGERRLNVLITRASEAKMVFASFEPSMIDLTRTSAQAVHDLKHYLEFAQRGPKALGEAVHSIGGMHDYDSDFEQAVADGLRRAGWTVRTQIGVSKFRIDLGIVHPDKPGTFLAGIECDGATYHSLPAARDRDRVRHVILESLGWRLLRLWSTDYFIDPAGSIEGLSRKLNGLLEEDARQDAKDAAARASDEEEAADLIEDQTTDEVLAEEAPDQFDDSKVVAIERPRKGPEAPSVEDILAKVAGLDSVSIDGAILSSDRFYEDGYRSVIRVMAADLIDEHGPVTFKYLADMIARQHGFKRTARRIIEVITESIKGVRPTSRGIEAEIVYWPDGAEPKELIAFRGNVVAGIHRVWGDLPYPEKLGLAAQTIKQRGTEDAPRGMAQKLELGRLTDVTRKEFEAAIAEVLRRAQEMRYHSG